jgi:hypothetical protein
MISFTRVLVVVLCAVIPQFAAAQDGLVVNGRNRSAERQFGADLGPAPVDWYLPLAGGGRYAVNDHSVRDRRTGLAIAVPTESRVLAIDPVRPRLFIRYDNNVTGTIAEFDLATGSSRPLITIGGSAALWADRVRYAYSADRLFVDVTEGTGAGPDVAALHPIQVFDGTTGRQVGGFTVSTFANGAEFTSPWLVTPDGARAYFDSSRFGFGFGPGAVKMVRVADGVTASYDVPVSRIQWDEVTERLFVYDGAAVHVLSAELALLGSAALDATASVQVSPHTGRLYVASGRFHGIYGGDVNLAVVDSRTFAPLGYANLGNDRSSALRLVTAPGAPRAFSATALGHDVTLDWTNVGAASHFVLEVGVGPGRTDASVFLGASTHVIFAHVPSGTYYLRLRGGNEFGGGRSSQEIQVVVP